MIQSVEASSEGAPLSTADRLADLRHFVAVEIRRMLDSDRELLFSILYRIDVPEKDVLECLSNPANDSIAERLADLVVKRQLRKIELRRRR